MPPARRRQLLETAAREFAGAGYESASLNRIIRACGMSKSSFYHYFPDKQRLHDHLIATLRDRLLAGLKLPQLDTLSAETFWTEAAALLANASVGAPTEGRVMYAALRALPVPEEPVARLWHAANMLREHRGDGHVVALVSERTGGTESHVLSALGMGSTPPSRSAGSTTSRRPSWQR